MKSLLMPWLIFVPMVRHGFKTFESILDRGGIKAMLVSILALIVFWHVYTPIHELLHVGACLLGGGTVSELALKPQYGGNILAPLFPFIVPESDYAGQLKGFTTPNYWVYALVDMAPYLLSLPGLALMEMARRGKQALLFGPAMVLSFVPVMSIPGDYYELASLLSTQLAQMMEPALSQGVLISDDVFRSWETLSAAGQLSPSLMALIFLGVLAAVYFSLFTLALQVQIARFLFGSDVLANDEVAA